MRTIIDEIGDMVIAKLRSVLLRVINPEISIDKVNEIDEIGIECLKKMYGIEGIILDVDETIRSNTRSIPQVNQDWIDKIKNDFKIVVVSNGMDGQLKDYFQKKKITYIPFAFKPAPNNFLKACEEMDLEPDKVLVVGDSLVSDIIGAKICKCKSALIKGVEEDIMR